MVVMKGAVSAREAERFGKAVPKLQDQYKALLYDLDRVIFGRAALGEYKEEAEIKQKINGIQEKAMNIKLKLPSKEDIRAELRREHPEFYQKVKEAKAIKFPNNLPKKLQDMALPNSIGWMKAGDVGARSPRDGGFWDAFMICVAEGEIRTGVQRADLKEYFLS